MRAKAESGRGRGPGGKRWHNEIINVSMEGQERHVLSAAKQDGHNQRMGKSDLEAVDQAVTCALENGEVVMVSWVVEDGLQCRH